LTLSGVAAGIASVRRRSHRLKSRTKRKAAEDEQGNCDT